MNAVQMVATVCFNLDDSVVSFVNKMFAKVTICSDLTVTSEKHKSAEKA